MPERKVEVTQVLDGDTFEAASVADGQATYRLLDLDTPERGEHGYHAAKDALEALIHGHEIHVEGDEKDDHGRFLVHVTTADGIHINQKMLEHNKK